MAAIPELTGNSKFTKNLKGIVKSISESPVPVFLSGERGTGKRLFSQKVHLAVSADLKGFYELNCRVLEDEGIKKLLQKIQDDSGLQKQTLFINNVNFLSWDMQTLFKETYLEHLLEKKVKIISSSEVEIENNRELNFNSDLFFRLSVVKLNFLPLRQRQEDILPIAQFYFKRFRRDSGLRFQGFSDSAVELMQKNFWKGNCDELINSIQRAFILGNEGLITASDLGIENKTGSEITSPDYESLQDKTLKTVVDNFKKDYVIKVLEANGWNQTKTAEVLGIQRTYVIKLINDFNIKNNKE
ncbi:MAG: sigma-54-dependent Fis family transcriptional regulator [Treponema sp.]|nr:sigma-54-dependent Fis family transcriptional regulator [Treponema sp.]